MSSIQRDDDTAVPHGFSYTSDEECRSVWHRHVRAAMAGDIEGVMEDFTDRSAIITTDAVITGAPAIRGFFEKLLGGLDQQANETTVMNAELVHGGTLVANFTIGSLGRIFHDTAVIQNGKFSVLSTVSYAADQTTS